MTTNANSNTASIFICLTISLFLTSCGNGEIRGNVSGSNGNNATSSNVKPYPLSTCIVTDNDLGSMGDEKSFIYENQELKVCCPPCVKKFYADPQKFLDKLPTK